MIIVRWIVGFFKTIVNLWGWYEWFYYTKTGFDPKAAAHQRWECFVKAADKVPETEAERLLPTKNHWLILRDKFMQTPDEVVFYSTDRERLEVLKEEYEREMRTRTAGDFYYKMIKSRNLDFIHGYKLLSEEPLVEGLEIDAEQEREKFLR
ncbi:hypothetical protein JW859_09500 [bacterium]|nr:hypothetical protein [bacterium]